MRRRIPASVGQAAVFVATAILAGCVPPAVPGPSAGGAMRMSMGMMGMPAHAHSTPASRAFPRLWEPTAAEAARPGAHLVEVKMVTLDDGDGGKFDPENVVAQAGDTIRFVTDGLSPHNVSFPPAQNAAPLQPPAPVPFLTTAGQSYDMIAPSVPGTYHMQCDPHAFTGMTGTLTVQP
jgi:plastocyanin